MFVSSLVSIASNQILFYSKVMFSFVVVRLESVSSAWLFMLAPGTTSNSRSERRRRQQTGLPLLCAKYIIHFKESWSVLTLNLVLFRYGRRT